MNKSSWLFQRDTETKKRKRISVEKSNFSNSLETKSMLLDYCEVNISHLEPNHCSGCRKKSLKSASLQGRTQSALGPPKMIIFSQFINVYNFLTPLSSLSFCQNYSLLSRVLACRGNRRLPPQCVQLRNLPG